MLFFLTSKATIIYQPFVNASIPFNGTSYSFTVNGTTINCEYESFFASGIHFSDPNYSNLIIAITGGSNYDQLKLLTTNTSIGSGFTYSVDGGSGYGTGSGQFTPGSEPAGAHFIGFKTIIGNYGWIKIFVTPGFKIDLIEYAYESVAGIPILAGNTGNLSVGDVNEKFHLKFFQIPQMIHFTLTVITNSQQLNFIMN